MEPSKEQPLEQLPKEELIVKCKRYLLLAQRAKHSRDECAEELKKSKDNENKLIHELSTLKEVLESASEKQRNVAETENKAKLLSKENAELISQLEKANKVIEDRSNEIKLLQETLGKLNRKISDFEIRATEDEVKVKDYELKLNKLKSEIALNDSKVVELQAKVKAAEDKYSIVDNKLVEFQDKYIEEKKQHSRLQSLLEKKLEEKSERSSTERSESRDGLQSVLENKEVENLFEKLQETENKAAGLELINKQLEERCLLVDQILKKLEETKNENNILKEGNSRIVQNCLQKCSDLEECGIRVAEEITVLGKRVVMLEGEKLKLEKAIKEASLEERKALQESSETEEKLLIELEQLRCEKTILGQSVSQLTEECLTHKEEKEKYLQIVQSLSLPIEAETGLAKSVDNLKEEMLPSLEKLTSEGKPTPHLIAQKETKQKNSKVASNEFVEMESKDSNVAANLNCASEDRIKQLTEQINALLVEKQKTENTLVEVTEKEHLLSSELDRVKEQNIYLESNIDSLKKEIGTEKVEVETLKVEIKALEKSKNERSNNNERLKELQSLVETLNEQIERLRVDNQAADEKLALMEAQLLNSRQVSESLEAMVKERCEEYDAFKAKVDAYEGVAAQLDGVSKNIAEAKAAYEALKGDVQSEISEFQEQHKYTGENVCQIVSDFVSKLVDSNAELLGEMNMMNQVLKERGATISKLEEEAATLQTAAAENDAKLKKAGDKFESAQSDLERLRDELEGKEKSLREMEEEIWRLKSQQDNPGDALSTSTISKVEESARLVDIEDSFEDKYTKLKVLAVKLKKRIIELQNQVEQDKNKLLTERADFQSKLVQFQAQIKTFQNLQTEYDKLQDQLDAEKKQSSELRKALEKARDETIALNKNADDIKNEREKFKQEKASFDIIKKELSGQIQSLKKMVEKEQMKVKEFDKDREKYEQEIMKREKKLEEESEKHRATLASLESQKLEQKKHSLLSLEMADYERTVTELSKRLDAKDNQVRELESSLETQRELTRSLQETVLSLESRVTAEQQMTDASKVQTSSLQDCVLQLRTELSAKVSTIAELERTCQERKLEAERLTLELAEVSTERAKFEEKNRSQLGLLTLELRKVEDKLSLQKEELERKELELVELKKEFENYKIRAQSVLRQSQKELPSGRQQDIEEEVKLLRTTSDSYRSKMEDALRKSQVLIDENQALVEEKTRLFNKVQELMKSVADLRAVNAELQTGEQRIREEGEENTRLLRLQLDTLAQVYKKEAEDQEGKFKKEIEEIRAALEQAERQLHLHVDTGYREPVGHRRNLSTGKAENPPVETAGHRRQPSANFVPVKSERETLDVLMLEREACEGSESVDSTSPRLVPLDQLLAPQASAVDLATLTDRLDKSDNRIQHLTALLSDAESDAARLQQLNEVLKEEIRRRERNEAREQHANNLEYLKNIVVKFTTLPRGDERLRLVPVLNTILKLSPDEESRLSNAARGISEQPGWGTYLGGMWTGGQ